MRVFFDFQREKKRNSLIPSKAHTLECQDRGSSHQVENLGCTRPPWMQAYRAWDTHRPLHAQEPHGTCIDCMQGNHMGCAHGQQHEKKCFPVFLGMLFNWWIWIWEHPVHKNEFQIFRFLFYNGFWSHYFPLC